jgi:hypothetical protein
LWYLTTFIIGFFCLIAGIVYFVEVHKPGGLKDGKDVFDSMISANCFSDDEINSAITASSTKYTIPAIKQKKPIIKVVKYHNPV